MAHRNSQQHGNPNVQMRNNHRHQMGESGYGYRDQQSAFQDSPSQYGGHYGADTNYSGSRQQGSFDPRADVRGYEGSYDSHFGPSGNTNPYGGGSYETNTRGDEYYNTRTNTREPWLGDNRAHSSWHEDSLNARRSYHDPDYQQWRDEQIRALDEDYKAWRDERYSAFSNEFGEWRKSRKDRPTSAAGGDANTGGAHSGSSATSKNK